jgi:hypothetical protein
MFFVCLRLQGFLTAELKSLGLKEGQMSPKLGLPSIAE